MSNKDRKLTSVRIDADLFQEFKLQCMHDNFSFQKLASRAIFLYLNDKGFKQRIHKQNTIKLK
jgi:hypothetical protein